MLKTDSLSSPVNEHRAMRTDFCTEALHENLEWRKFGFLKKKKKKEFIQFRALT